jgi:hypothetical protein
VEWAVYKPRNLVYIHLINVADKQRVETTEHKAMKSTANITPATTNAGRLAKFDATTLQFAVDTLSQELKQDSVDVKSPEQGVKAVLELRQAIAIKKVGGLEKFATVQSLAEALLQVTVCDGVGLPYDEILFVVLSHFGKNKTTMNCVRWYASNMQNRGENPVKLPPRPASTSVAAA